MYRDWQYAFEGSIEVVVVFDCAAVDHQGDGNISS